MTNMATALSLKGIGDSLTDAEFSAYVLLLRNLIILTEKFKIRDKVIGEYGEYDFDFNDSTLTDKGLLITDETLENPNTVSLINPLFINSNYHFLFKIMKIRDYNLYYEGQENYISYEELELVLNNDEDSKVLYLSDYDEGMILLLDCTVKVTHDYVKVEEVA